ncbi:MAG: chromate transporter [Candidatus Brocadiia bacterium]
MATLVRLFQSFMLIGLGAYGGGLVTIPLIQHELVGAQRWLTFKEMAQLLAVAQMTPGPIAVNAATFVGFRLGSLPGAATATVAVVLPSLAILLFLAPSMDAVGRNPHVQRLRQGIQIGVLSLVVYATFSYGCAAIEGGLDLALAVAAFLVLVAFEGKLHPLLVMLACGAVGLIAS